MTPEEALNIIKASTLVPGMKHRILRGLQILTNHDEDLDIGITFEHDQMWAGDFEYTVSKMTKEEVEEMAGLGWFRADDSWSHF